MLVKTDRVVVDFLLLKELHNDALPEPYNSNYFSLKLLGNRKSQHSISLSVSYKGHMFNRTIHCDVKKNIVGTSEYRMRPLALPGLTLQEMLSHSCSGVLFRVCRLYSV